MRVYLEITNICNRQCSFCPGTKRQKLFADADKLQTRLEKISSCAKELYLHVMGEPLLHPQFERIVQMCEKAQIPVNLTTNGTLLTEEKQFLLLNSPIFRQINISLQSLEQNELDHLDNILDFALKALVQREELYVNLRMWNASREDFALPEKDLFFLRRIFERLALPLEESLTFHKKKRSLPLKGRLYLHCNDLFQWPVQVKKPSLPSGEKVFCHGLLRQCAILVDGSVVPCCLDSEGIMTLGNLDEHETLEEILTSPRAQKIKDGFRNGTAAEELCAKCSYRSTHVAAVRRGVAH